MRFQLAHKLVTYLLVLSALAALGGHARALARRARCAVPRRRARCSFGVDAGNRLRRRARSRGRRPRAWRRSRCWRRCVWRIWRRLPDPDYGAGVRPRARRCSATSCFYRRTHRDYVHMLAFSFLLVLVASTLAASFSFVAAFAVYVAFAVWALILFHLRREMEENYLVKHSAQAPSQKVGVGRILGSRRVVGRAFFVATARGGRGGAGGRDRDLHASSPASGAGFVLGGAPASSNVVAAADEIVARPLRHDRRRTGTRWCCGRRLPRLAALAAATRPAGSAADGSTSAARSTTSTSAGAGPAAGRPELADGRRRGRRRRARRFWVHELGEDRRAAGIRPTGAGRTRSVRQEIEAVGIPASVLFAIDRAGGARAARDAARRRRRAAGRAALVGRDRAARGRRGQATATASSRSPHAHYVAYSRPRPAGERRADSPPTASCARSSTTSRCPTALQPRAAKRARRRGSALAEPAPAAIAPDERAGSRRWSTGCAPGTRTRTRPPPRPAGVDPVEDFLFSQPAGHCELFASAAVLLLRAAGVPARYVTGFRGGDWNAVGGYVAVRDDRAHAWAEAFVPDAGWVRVDATPPGAPPAPRRPPGRDRGRARLTSGAAGSSATTSAAPARSRAPAWHGSAPLGPPRALAADSAIAAASSPAALTALGLAAAPPAAPARARPPRLGAARRSTGRPSAANGRRRSIASTAGRWAGSRAPAGRGARTRRRTSTRARLRAAGPFARDDAFDGLTDRYAAARFGGQQPADETVAALGRTIGDVLSGRSKTSRSP